jgi:hypothetical protein
MIPARRYPRIALNPYSQVVRGEDSLWDCFPGSIFASIASDALAGKRFQIHSCFTSLPTPNSEEPILMIRKQGEESPS